MRRGRRAPPVGSACRAWRSAGLRPHRVPRLLLVDPEGAEQESGSSLEDRANPEELQWRLPVPRSVAWKQPSAHTLENVRGCASGPWRLCKPPGQIFPQHKTKFRLFVKLSLATPL